MTQVGHILLKPIDPPWDDSLGKDLVEIARSKFKEAEGVRERPDAIE